MDEDYWRDQEIFVGGLLAQAAGVLQEMIDESDEDEDITFLVNLREHCLNGADIMVPPGEPDEGYSAPIISLDRYRAKINR